MVVIKSAVLARGGLKIVSSRWKSRVIESHRAAEQFLDADVRGVLLDEGLADQDRADAGILQQVDVVDGEDSRLANHGDAASLNLLAERPVHEIGGDAQADLKRSQIPVVDAEQIDGKVSVQHALHLPVRVHLDQALHAQRVRNLNEVLQILVGQNRGDQQNRVGAVLAREINLIRVHDELLAEQRARHPSLANERQVFKSTLKELFIRQHAQTRRPTLLVRLRDFHRIKIRLNHPLRRRRLLHLRDQSRLFRRRQLIRDRLHKIPRRRRVHQRRSHQLQREFLLAFREFHVFIPHDLLQDVLRLVVLVRHPLARRRDFLDHELKLSDAQVVLGRSVRRSSSDAHRAVVHARGRARARARRASRASRVPSRARRERRASRRGGHRARRRSFARACDAAGASFARPDNLVES